MKKILLFNLIFLTGFICSSFGQELRVSCSINAGEPQAVCWDEGSFFLNGGGSGIDPTSIQWSVTPTSPVLFDVNNPNDFGTNVNYTINTPPGTSQVYTFQICGTCEQDDSQICNTTTVTIGSPAGQPDIAVDGVSLDDVTVCTQAVLDGSPDQNGEWDFSNYGIINTPGFSNNNTTATITTRNYNNVDCRTVEAYYTVNSDGCTATDTINVTFIGTRSNVTVSGWPIQDGGGYCSDGQHSFSGSSVGCNSNFSFTMVQQSTGNIIPPDNTFSTPSVTYTFPANGFYTVTYTVDPDDGGFCTGGTASMTFYICLSELTIDNTYSYGNFCGDYDEPIQLSSTSGLDCNYSDWWVVPAGAAVITPDPLDPSQATATMIDQSINSISFFQNISCDTCFFTNGQGEPDTIFCTAQHRTLIRRAATFDVESDTVNFICGGDPNYRPWDDIDFTGTAFGSGGVVVASPDPDIVGDPINTSTRFDVTEEGQYIFCYWVSLLDDNGVLCTDTTKLVVNVDQVPTPEAGDVGIICVGEDVVITGSTPSNPAVNPYWQQVDPNNGGEISISDPSAISPTINVSAPGTYYLEYSYSQDPDCYLADTLEVVVEVCDTTPCTEVVSIECVEDKEGNISYDFVLHIQDPTGCVVATTLYLLNGDGVITAQNDYYDPVNQVHVIEGNFVPVDNSVTDFCYRIAFKGCVPCDPTIGCEPLPKCCEKDLKWEFKDITCRDGVYSYVLIVYDGASFVNGFTLTNNGLGNSSYISYPSGNDLVIEGTVSGLPSNNLCIYIDFEDSRICDIEACKLVKPCGCEVSPRWEFKEIVCNENGNYSFTLIVYGVASLNNAFTLTTNGNDPILYGSNVVGNDIEINGFVTGLTFPGQLCVFIDFEDNRKFCDVRACVDLPPCCREYKSYFKEVNCRISFGNQFHDFTYVVEGVGSNGSSFNITANNGLLSNVNSTVSGNDLVITGSVINATAPGQLCISINFEDPRICDIRDCVDIRPCCERVRAFLDTIYCAVDEEGNEAYAFEVFVGNPFGISAQFNLDVTCGTLSNLVFTPGLFGTTVTGLITNPTSDPGSQCCFSVDFQSPYICDTRFCFELPPCECVTDVTPIYPDCVEPGESFCATYTFNYYGPPLNNVVAQWLVQNNAAGIVITSAVNVSTGTNEVSPGFNEWEICFNYSADSCVQDLSLNILAQFFHPDAGLCCTIEDMPPLECCCPNISIETCTIELGERAPTPTNKIRDYVVKTFGQSKDPQMKKLVDKYKSGRSDCGEEGGEGSAKGERSEFVAEQDSCCEICEGPDFFGAIWVVEEGSTSPLGLFGGDYTFEWEQNGAPYGGNTAVIGGEPFYTYSVTVTDNETGCVMTAEIYIDCGGIGLTEGEGGIKVRNSQGNTTLTIADMKVFPNPTSNELYLNSSAIHVDSKIEIVDLTGRTIRTVRADYDNYLKLNVGDLSEGTYFIRLTNKESQQPITKRFVIIR